MKKTITILLFSFLFLACNETVTTNSSDNLTSGNDGTTITGITTTPSNLLESYTLSSFSQHIYFHKTEDKILIDYNFFPAEADICQQVTYNAETNINGCQTAKSVVMPCAYQPLTENDLLSINISAPTETEACDTEVVLDMSQAEFTVEGFVFTFEGTLTVFDPYFEFSITNDGFVDVDDSQKLDFESADIDLEDVYAKVLEKRVS